MESLPAPLVAIALASIATSLGFLLRALAHGLRIERHHQGDSK